MCVCVCVCVSVRVCVCVCVCAFCCCAAGYRDAEVKLVKVPSARFVCWQEFSTLKAFAFPDLFKFFLSVLALERRHTKTVTKTESPMVNLTWHASKY